jgi:hypothetical protein
MDTPFIDSVIDNDPVGGDENLSNSELGNDGDD